MRIIASVAAASVCIAAATATAQPARAPLQLGTLQREALAADPRAREFDLQQAQTDLRLRNIEVERLPTAGALGQAQYQSDVPRAPFSLPTGQPLFSPPHDTYDVSLRVDQRLVDPTNAPRAALTRAELEESQARLRTTLASLKTEVAEAFFAAAVLQEHIEALSATLTDLEGRLQETSGRVREGAAVPGEAAAVEATLLQQRQRIDELRTNRHAAIARLAALAGRAIADDAPVELPDLDAAVAAARADLAHVRARPEYDQFARTRDRLARQEDVAAAGTRPQLSAFGRVGYGKPGLNFIDDRFESYAVGGVQVQWKAWTWGSTARDTEALAIQQQIVTRDEAAFSDAIRRAALGDLAAIDHLHAAIAFDDRIVALREAIDRGAHARFAEGVATASEYLDRTTELLGARFDRARHRVELAQANARLLNTLGLEVK